MVLYPSNFPYNVVVSRKGPFKGKLAHELSTCYLECISYHLPIDKKFMAEKIGKKLYNPCIQVKENQIWKSYQCGFPNNSPCDIIRWGIPINNEMEFLYY